jgi:hypothetical protein
MSKPWVALSFVVVLSACSIAARRAAAPPRPATTQASTETVRTLKLSDAVPINRFRGENTDVDLRQHIAYEAHDDLYFGQCDTLDANGETAATEPLVVANVHGGWSAVTLKDDRLANAEWQFVASGPAAAEIWGVLDDSLDNKGKVLLLAHSTDGGKTWNVSVIQKPFGVGDYDSFCMDKSGRGRVTVYVTGDSREPRGARDHRRGQAGRGRSGFYHIRTTDGGKTWAKPEHEPDALDPADDVPADGEDPEPHKDSPLRSVRFPSRAMQQ